jgi:hypothetical protein
MLAREAEPLAEALDHLEGKAEWSVKVFAYPAAAREPEPAPQSSGTDYMRRRQSERDRRRSIDRELHHACVSIHERLGAMVVEATTNEPQRPEVNGHAVPMLLNGVYLVEDAQLESFMALVDELQDEYRPQGLELHSTGPWPPYSFVPGTIGAQ